MAVDYKPVAQAALQQASTLLPAWIGGHREGHEWLAERRANGGLGDSLKVNLETGLWSHFGAGGAQRPGGSDLIGLYAYVKHLAPGAAYSQIAAQVGITERAVQVLPRARAGPDPNQLQPIPDNPPQAPAHQVHGYAAEIYKYGQQQWVCRYETPHGKTFSLLTWRNGRWSFTGHPGPLQLYGAELLAAHPDRKVLVVEGEKCANRARPILKQSVIVTWAGGAGAVHKTDWTTLRNREVTIWPDADEPGRKAAAAIAAILEPVARRVRVLHTNGKANGWDVADAIAEGWNAETILTWVDEHVIEPAAPRVEVLPPADPESDYPAGSAPQSYLAIWQSLGLMSDAKEIPHPTLSNASTILQYQPPYRGKIWFDTFRSAVWHSVAGAPRPWTDADDRRATTFIQQRLGLPKIHSGIVQEAVLHAAECQPRNTLTEWLDSLVWDGIPRLTTWLADCLGVERDAYHDAVARNWPISMVARAYDPGCKVDTMPVLEADQGTGKSTFLKVLGHPWFAALKMAFGEKDFLQAIQGRWLVEIPDMAGFSRREHSDILATISDARDVYRKTYARVTEEHPRVTVFAATSENNEYLQETRGRRRYWPLVCGTINTDTLQAQRAQIFAEAVIEYRNGSQWHEVPENESDEIQSARASRDIWTDTVMHYAEHYGESKLTSCAILTNCINMELSRQDDAAKRRIYRIMTENGWKQLRDRKERFWRQATTAKG